MTVGILGTTAVKRALSFSERPLQPYDRFSSRLFKNVLDPSIKDRPQQEARIVSLNGSYVRCRNMIHFIFPNIEQLAVEQFYNCWRKKYFQRTFQLI